MPTEIKDRSAEAHNVKHLAVIMDGNGRWAKKRLQNRTAGHSKGVDVARAIIKECAELRMEALTLYTFSLENWQRPQVEVSFLMRLLESYLLNEAKEIVDNGIRFRAIGFTTMLPEAVQKQIAALEAQSKNNQGMILNLALSYGSRQELVESTRLIAMKVQEGKLKVEDIGESTVEDHLFTHGLPPPDLLIRTGGDHRISNFLLWQIAYAELYFTERCWPDFSVEQLHEALSTFSQRERRFGKVLDMDGYASHGT